MEQLKGQDFNQKLRDITPGLGSNPGLQEILEYTHNAFDHDGLNRPENMDPFTVLAQAKAGEKMRCVEYAILASSLLTAYGTPARRIAGFEAADEDFNGHVFIEYWDSEAEKWSMHDPQWGITPYSGDVPLSAYELRQAFEAKKQIDFHTLPSLRPGVDPGEYTDWVQPYMDVFDTPGVVPVTDHKTLQEHVDEHRLRLSRNPDIAAKVAGVGPSYIQEVSSEQFYAPPQ